MINVALVGYRKFPLSGNGDIITGLIPDIIDHYPELNQCHTDIVEDRNGEGIDRHVERMLRSGVDVVHYVNYRDPYPDSPGSDVKYMDALRKSSRLPVILTSAHPEAGDFARQYTNTLHLDVPFSVKKYVGSLFDVKGITAKVPYLK